MTPVKRVLLSTTAFLISVGTVTYFLKYMPEFFLLNDFLPKASVWSLRMSLSLLAVGVIFGFRSLIFHWSVSTIETKKQFWALIGLAAVVLAFVVPRAHRLYYDEHIYENIGQSIFATGESYLANEAYSHYGEYRGVSKYYNKQPSGFPFLLSLLYGIVGVSDDLSFLLNEISLLLTLLIVFLISMKLFRSEQAAIFSMAALVAMPMVLRWSNTVAAETVAMLFGALIIHGALCFRENRSIPTMLYFIGATAFGLQVRPESMLLGVPVFLILFLNLEPREKWKKMEFVIGALSVLLIPYVIHLFMFKDNNWGNEGGEKFSIKIFFENIKINGWFYWEHTRFPSFVSFFALVSFLGKQKDRHHSLCLSLIWFLLMWGVFLFFYAGSYNYGVDVRYSLISAVPLALLAGYGCSRFCEWMSHKFNLELKSVIKSVGIVALFFCLPLMYQARILGEEPREARLDSELAKEWSKKLPEDSVVLSHNSGMWLVFGVSSAQAFMALDNPDFVYKNLMSRHAGKVFFHWNFWCNVENPGQSSVCTRFIEKYPHKVFQETQMYHKKYGLYEILPLEKKAKQ